MSAPAQAALGLGYDDLGTGEPGLLLLTGWCSSRARWARAAPLLARSRRVVNFEWPGHGDSRPVDSDFGHAEMVDEALAMIDAAGLHTVIPCAASHSGWVALELSRRLGERVPAVVHLDWLLFEPSGPYMELLDQLQDSNGWPLARDKLFEIWRAGVENAHIDAAIEVMNRQGAEMWIRSGREIAGAYRRAGSPLATYSAMDRPPRVLHLYGQPPADEYLKAQQQFAAEHDWFSVRRIDARTHFAMIECPQVVAEAIEEVAGSHDR
jgi:pimeloyl-ACP methyl ester carboxylesterase